ncbi:uncharacterized protein LOC143288733 [Babylonia areolata]|uniref:uncharacterized protein LOC143288733 n=1 Tax=Babylonia areolata TaxID=304850 RepID=UPI003FD4B86C
MGRGKNNKKRSNNITIDEWYEHFKNVLGNDTDYFSHELPEFDRFEEPEHIFNTITEEEVCRRTPRITPQPSETPPPHTPSKPPPTPTPSTSHTPYILICRLSFTTTTAANTTTTDNDDDYNYSSSFNVTSAYPPSPLPPDVAIKVLARFRLIALPTIAVLGIVSNTLSFCIFVSKTLRRTSCSIYLAARSVSDTGFLLALFLTWLGDAMAVPLVHTVVVCQLVVFASYVFGFLSVWLVVGITLENYIRICHPFSVSRFCTVQKARRVLLGVVVVSVAVYQFPLWMTHVVSIHGQQRCGNKHHFINIFQILVYMDMIITLALPSIVIIFFMIAICISLVKSLKRQSRLKVYQRSSTFMTDTVTPLVTLWSKTASTVDTDQASTPHDASTPNGRPSPQGQGQHSSALNRKKNASGRRSSSPQAKVTRLLFAVSFTFLLLSLPSHIVRLRMVMLMMVEQNSLNPNLDQMLQVVFQILYYLSFAVNLVVYLCCGESFRNVFIDTYISCLVGRRQGASRAGETTHTTYTVVRMEQQEMTERKEEETSLIS